MALILALIMSEALPSSALVDLERSIPTSLNAFQSTPALKSKLSDPTNLPQLALLGTSSIALAGVFASIVPRDFDSYLREGLGTRKLNHLLHLIRASTAARSDCAHGSSPAAWASRCSRTSSPASYALDLNTDFSPDDHFSSHAVYTTAPQSMALFGVSDMLAQKFEQRRDLFSLSLSFPPPKTSQNHAGAQRVVRNHTPHDIHVAEMSLLRSLVGRDVIDCRRVLSAVLIGLVLNSFGWVYWLYYLEFLVPSNAVGFDSIEGVASLSAKAFLDAAVSCIQVLAIMKSHALNLTFRATRFIHV